METDLSTAANAAMMEESIFPIGGYGNGSSSSSSGSSGGGGGGAGGDDGSGTSSSILLSPRRDPLYVVVPMTVIYSLIFATGIVGNVVTFTVIVRNKHMHTATNYYLLSLAISDLLLLVSGLPQEMVSIWIRYPYLFGEVFCILRGLSAETSTNASVLTITAFTVERYVAICHPFLSQTMSKLSRAVKLIVLIWFAAFSFAIPQAMQFGVIIVDDDPNQAVCTMKRTIIDHSFVLSSFFFFVTPMTLITVLYVLIGIKLRKSNMINRNGSSVYGRSETRESLRGGDHPHNHHQSSRRVIQMLVAVVVAFFICWAPFHAQRLVYTYGSNDDNKPKGAALKLIYEIITYISGVLYYVSSTINPILYHIMSHKFREAFKETLARCPCLGGRKMGRGGKAYLILNRYYRREQSSRRGTQSFDVENCGHLMGDDSIPANGTTCDASSSKYKYRRKTVSLSEATDDSTRTEMTQISHRPDSPIHRGSSHNRFAVVVRIGKLDFQPESDGKKNKWGREKKSREKTYKFWNVFECIQRKSRTDRVKTETNSSGSQKWIAEEKSNSSRIGEEEEEEEEEELTFLNGKNPAISETEADGKEVKVSNNAGLSDAGSGSRGSTGSGIENRFSDEEKKNDRSSIRPENGGEKKRRENLISVPFEPVISGSFPSSFPTVK